MSLNEKEELLKVEIFNKGYDLEDFSSYMDKQKENGNLNNIYFRWHRYRHMDI